MSKPCVLRTAILLLICLSGTNSQAQQRMQLPAATVSFPEGREFVELPFSLERDKILIPVRVNGSEPLIFVLDTGAPIAGLLDGALAEGMDLQIMGQAQLGGMGAGTAMMVELAGGVEFELGEITISNATMALGIGRGKLLDSGWDGIIGRSVFANLVVEMDFTEQVLRLYPPDSFQYQGDGEEIPMTIVGGAFPYVEGMVRVDDGPAVPVSMVVDTGASHALLLFVDEIPELEMPAKTIGGVMGWGASGPVDGRAGRITSLGLGKYELHEVITTFPNTESSAALPPQRPGGPPRQGNLGVQALQRFRVLFDFTNSRMILEPNDNFDAPFVYNRSGLTAAPWAPGDAQIEVASVMDASPAAEAGIQEGDLILEMNGEPVAEIEVNQVRWLLEQPAGSKLTLLVQRGTETMEIELTLQTLL